MIEVSVDFILSIVFASCAISIFIGIVIGIGLGAKDMVNKMVKARICKYCINSAGVKYLISVADSWSADEELPENKVRI